MMMVSKRWFDRKFALRLPPEEFPALLERLRSTHTRIVEMVRPVEPAVLIHRQHESWSIQEHVGHLIDLEPLWKGRLEGLLLGAKTLEAADLQNRKTNEARHNERRIEDLLDSFRAAREALVERLGGVTDPQLFHEAPHPRLNEPMNVTGLCFFVAEHDDHLLAAMQSRISIEPGPER
ncbi:MAG: DinB family protein [Acidobacteria bacterium]|nr:DinB family protein [Acidobacteriota bacterium]